MFTGKVALITGAAQGLGKSFASALLQKQCKVCVADINEEKLQATVREFQDIYGENYVVSAKCDVTKELDFEETFKRAKAVFNQIDIVVNNAGVVDERNWERCLDINLAGVIRGTLLGLRYMRKDLGGTGGTIVNVSSMAGIYPAEFSPVYCASKHGVVGYTRSWAIHPEVEKNGVRLLCLCPSFAKTDILDYQPESSKDLELVQKSMKTIGMMRVEEVSDAFIKLLEDSDNNGSVMSVTKQGTRYWKMPAPKF
ncbi:15-hydroxyprostaglandin dehydrogenase [NAD(+)]-like [Saccostrea echinata]|uniref:15-hydroxyprostaglandin dehydrogenase [NAD(+)]-like n=1 Tax=Saccostrea echinata TaxID=191078 RepID=UPI002A8257FE|nr:15-hydroxyprostaglandin dehydrogenase [NAD(+)]-like [Saccostrea echinata]